MRKLQQEGKVRHIGISEVSVAELQQAKREATIVPVQNRYSMVDRRSEALLEHCAAHGIAFIPGRRSGRPPARHGTARRHRRGHGRVADAGGDHLVAAPVAGDAAHPGHLVGGPPGGHMRAATVQLADADMEALSTLRS